MTNPIDQTNEVIKITVPQDEIKSKSLKINLTVLKNIFKII